LKNKTKQSSEEWYDYKEQINRVQCNKLHEKRYRGKRNGGSYMYMCHTGDMVHSFQHEHQYQIAAGSQSFWALIAMFAASWASHLARLASAGR
jgi:hypothetical protein